MCLLDPSQEIGNKFWKGLVPDEALEIPCQEDIPDVFKDEVAVLEDGALMRVAKARAVVERQMGRRLARLRDTDGFIKLGFVRMGDYVKERPQIGCRTAQEMARVGAALENLPVLRQASDQGRLNMSQIRLLVRIVTPGNEIAWAARASGLSVRELQEEIKRLEPQEAAPRSDTDPSESDTTEEAATARLSYEAPASFGAKWEAAVDFFRKVEGRNDIPPGAAAEAFAAEWQSGVPSSPAPMNEETKPYSNPQEDSPQCSGVAEPKTTERPAGRNDVQKGIEEEYKRWAFLDQNDPRKVNLPDWLPAFDGDLPNDPFELDAELVELEGARRELDAMDGRMLGTLDRLKVFRHMRFLDLGHYSIERMGMGRSTARRLRWIERHMHDLPEARAAYYTGEIGLAKVVQLIRVRHAPNRADWVERAKQVTVRRLEQEVRLVLRRVALYESGLLPMKVRDNPWALFPEGADLVRSASALDEIARKGPRQGATISGPTVTIRCSMEPDALEFWKECVDRCRRLFGRELAEWECANRFIDAFFEAYDKKDPLRYALNHKTFERDGWQCQVPGCSCRGRLKSHHVEFLSQNGADTLPNRTSACTLHHDALHAGTIKAVGTAPDNLIWRLGVNEEGEALLTVGPGEKIL